MINKFIKSNWLAISLYLFLALVFTYPLILHFTSQIPGKWDYTDGTFFIWNFWFFEKAITGTQHLWTTDLVFYPQQVDLTLHTLTIFLDLIALFLKPFFSYIAIYNILVLGSMVLSGFGTYLLVKYLIKNHWASLVSGITYAFTPYVFSHLDAGHFNLIQTWTIPFFALFFLKAIYEKKLFFSLFAALFLIIQSYIDLHYLFLMVVFVVVFFCWQAIFNRKIFAIELIKKIAIATIFWLIVFSPFMVKIISNYLQPSETKHIQEKKSYEYSDLKNYLIPSYFHPLLDANYQTFVEEQKGSYRENTVSLGYVVMVLAFMSFFIRDKSPDKKRWFWLVCFLVFFILSLGSRFKFNGEVYFYLPYYYLEKLPLLGQDIVTSRFIIFGILSLSILAGYSLSQIQKTKNRTISMVFFLLAISGIIFEFYPGQVNIDNLETPMVYQNLAKGDYTVLSIPTNPKEQYYQTIHGKKIIGASLGRRVSEKTNYNAYYDQFAGIEILLHPEREIKNDHLNKNLVKNNLDKLKVGYIVILKTELNQESYQKITNYIEKILEIPIYYDDQISRSYRLPENSQ